LAFASKNQSIATVDFAERALAVVIPTKPKADRFCTGDWPLATSDKVRPLGHLGDLRRWRLAWILAIATGYSPGQRW